MEVAASPNPTGGSKQRLFIIRHGERLDNVDYSWESTAERPYDPPLTAQGVEEAVAAAREQFKGKVGRDGESRDSISDNDVRPWPTSMNNRPLELGCDVTTV